MQRGDLREYRSCVALSSQRAEATYRLPALSPGPSNADGRSAPALSDTEAGAPAAAGAARPRRLTPACPPLAPSSPSVHGPSAADSGSHACELPTPFPRWADLRYPLGTTADGQRQSGSDHGSLEDKELMAECEVLEGDGRRPEEYSATERLGEHLKTGQSWTGQNRPVGRAPQAVRVSYRMAV